MSKFVLLGFLVIWLSTNIVNSEEDALKIAIQSSDDAELDSFTDAIQEDDVPLPIRKRRTLTSLADDDELDEFDDDEEDEFDDDDEEDEFDDEEDDEEEDGEETELDAMSEFLDRDSPEPEALEKKGKREKGKKGKKVKKAKRGKKERVERNLERNQERNLERNLQRNLLLVQNQHFVVKASPRILNVSTPNLPRVAKAITIIKVNSKMKS